LSCGVVDVELGLVVDFDDSKVCAAVRDASALAADIINDKRVAPSFLAPGLRYPFDLTRLDAALRSLSRPSRLAAAVPINLA